MLKKIGTTIVIIILLVSMSTMFVSRTFATETATTDKVYYSDLFYGYDTSYLSDNGMMKLHINQTSNILADIYNDYADSNAGFWSMFKTGLNMSIDAMFKLDFKEYAGLMSDTYGSTNYIYTNALDSANEIFAKELLKPEYTSMAGRTAAEFGVAAKFASRANSLLKLYEEVQNHYDPNEASKVEVFNLMFDWLKNQGFFN